MHDKSKRSHLISEHVTKLSSPQLYIEIVFYSLKAELKWVNVKYFGTILGLIYSITHCIFKQIIMVDRFISGI